MADGQGDWKEDVQDDLQLAEIREWDPIAELACDLALCYMAIEDHRGGWCDFCTCQLKYHVTITEGRFMGECELCGCDEHKLKPYSPTYIVSQRSTSRPEREVAEEDYDRAAEARKALKELTE